MRTMRTLLALLLLAAPVAGQQLDVVVSGGVSYRVATADSDSTISTHATYHVALESAANFALRTGRMALILHTSETRVRAVSLQEPPVVEEPPTDEPDEPQEPDEPEDPPTDPVEPTGPGDAWYVQDWTSLSGVEDSTQGGSGSISLIAGPTPGTRALRATFVDAGHGETQVGATFSFPRASTDRPREIWVEYDARWSSNWTVDGPYRNGGTCGHKHSFLFDERETGADGGRWETYIGLFNSIMSQEISGTLAIPADQRTTYSPSHRALWNGEWHRIRYHARMHPTQGVWDMWVNGQKFTWGVGNTDYGAQHYFNRFAASRNMNCGTDRTMTLDFGPVRVYTSDPGW